MKQLASCIFRFLIIISNDLESLTRVGPAVAFAGNERLQEEDGRGITAVPAIFYGTIEFWRIWKTLLTEEAGNFEFRVDARFELPQPF